jgi:predicted transcriptional regulator
MSKRATIYVDEELHRSLKIKAAALDRTISEIVNEAIRRELAEDADDLAAFEDLANEPVRPFGEVARTMRVSEPRVPFGLTDYRRLETLARAEGRSPAELMHEAFTEYAKRRATALQPTSLGAGHSGRGDLSERAEELLGGMGRDE